MYLNRFTLIPGVMALCLAAPVSAQQPATPAQPMTPPAAATTADCEAQFASRDTDGNGALSETEAPSLYAQARIDGKVIADTGVTKEDFLATCDADGYARTAPEAGAPFEGANSFTENQARDRAIAWGLTDVAEMTKDDKGIWRSSGMLDGASVDVAVDYKGNIVTTPK